MATCHVYLFHFLPDSYMMPMFAVQADKKCKGQGFMMDKQCTAIIRCLFRKMLPFSG